MRIRAENVHKTYGDVTALDGLSLEIPSGTTFGVLGTNGAGKTTLFKLLVGLDRPDDGELLVGETPVSAAGPDLREHVGYLPERVGFPDALTGREVLRYHARMRGGVPDGRIAETLDVVGLDDSAADRPVEGYSNGMRRRLGLATAVLSRPSVLVLDEPTAGLDPRGVTEFHRIIDRVRTETDATVVLSSHVLSEVERICDRVAVFHDGRVLESGPVAELADGAETVVKIVPVDPDDVEAVLEAGGDVGRASATDGTVTVRCPAGSMPSLFADLAAVAVDDVVVEQHGLETAFHDALDAEVSA